MDGSFVFLYLVCAWFCLISEDGCAYWGEYLFICSCRWWLFG